jgi:Fur family ferric uptake transcriptional regulator
MVSTIATRCKEKGLKMTGPRKTISEALSLSEDHPDAETLYQRVQSIDKTVSLATVYRTLKLFEESEIIEKLDFGDGRSRFEKAPREHHDHLIDIETGDVIEFQNDAIEQIQREVAERLGYELTAHRLELFGKKIGPVTK